MPTLHRWKPPPTYNPQNGLQLRGMVFREAILKNLAIIFKVRKCCIIKAVLLISFILLIVLGFVGTRSVALLFRFVQE